MFKAIRIVLVFMVMALFVAPDAMAQKAPPKKPTREMDFEGDVVEAQFLRPDQSVAEALVRRHKSSLIQIRTDFVDEILKSAEDL
ncbi:MAG: hypothetical protein GXP54_05745 [Deltaproteobacteria bacterium]|nr:hypothetical protein [Deltaproteobacteria bacterium]